MNATGQGSVTELEEDHCKRRSKMAIWTVICAVISVPTLLIGLADTGRGIDVRTALYFIAGGPTVLVIMGLERLAGEWRPIFSKAIIPLYCTQWLSIWLLGCFYIGRAGKAPVALLLGGLLFFGIASALTFWLLYGR